MDDQDVIREFLIESNESLARLDQEMVELEKRPQDPQLLASIFRTIHTIKGTCGFLGFARLEGVTPLAENILSQVRDGKRQLTPELVTLILETVDVVKTVLVAIEANGREGTETYEDLRKRLQAACTQTAVPAAAGLPAGDTPTTAPDPDEKTAAPKGPSVSDSTIRVDVVLLDKLMNLVGELVLTRNQILQFNAHQEDSTLNATSQRLNLITTELQEGVMKTRMQPIGVFGTNCRGWCAIWPLLSANRFAWRWKGRIPSSTKPSSKPSRTRSPTSSATVATTGLKSPTCASATASRPKAS